MKGWKILRDCRLKGDGLHHAMLGIDAFSEIRPGELHQALPEAPTRLVAGRNYCGIGGQATGSERQRSPVALPLASLEERLGESRRSNRTMELRTDRREPGSAVHGPPSP